MTSIAAITAADRDEWLSLWRAYLVFSGSTLPQDVTDDVFARLVEGRELHGGVARDADGAAIGFVH